MNHMSTTYHELRAHHFSKKFAGSSFQLKQTISDRVALSVISERSPTERQVLNIIQFYHRKIKVHVCIIRPWLKYFQLNLTLHKFPPALFLAWIFLSRFQEHSTPSLAYREWTHRRTEGRPCSRSSPQVLEKRNNACSSKNILLHSLLGWGGSGKKPKTVRKKPPSKPVF